MVATVVDQRHRLLQDLLRVAGTRAEDARELPLVPLHVLYRFLQLVLALGAGEAPAHAVVHHHRVRQRDANVGTLHEPQCAALRFEDDEGEVHVEERAQHQHAVVGFAAVVDASTGAGEDDGDARSRVLSGERFQHGDLALRACHACVPDEDVLAVDGFDGSTAAVVASRAAVLQLYCLVGCLVLHGDLLSQGVEKQPFSRFRKTPAGCGSDKPKLCVLHNPAVVF